VIEEDVEEVEVDFIRGLAVVNGKMLGPRETAKILWQM